MSLLKRLLPRPQVKLAQTQEEFDAQADAFLAENGFPLDADHRALFGSFIQHSDDSEDSFDPTLMRKRIRKAIATRLAFYLIKPDQRPKPELKDVQPVQDKSVS